MKIDAHQHFWRFEPEEFGWISEDRAILRRDYLPGDLEPELDAAGFDATVAVQGRQTLAETRWLLDLATRHPFIAGVVGWVDLVSPQAEAQIQEFIRHPAFVGVRQVLHDEPPGFTRSPAFRQGLGLLQIYGLTYDLLIFPSQLPEIVDLVQEFPQQKFVLDHLGKPWAEPLSRKEWRHHLGRLAACPNVTAKLSALVPEGSHAPWASDETQVSLDAAWETFGEDRLMVGSNWPVCREAASYVRTLGWVTQYLAAFPEAAQRKVLGDNALSAYGLKLRDSGH